MKCCSSGSNPVEVILRFDHIRVEKILRRISCVRLPTTSEWSSGKDYGL